MAETTRMVYLKNMVNATVSVKKPEFGVNRKWNKRGQTQALPFEVVEQLLWTEGFSNMIHKGILYIDDLQTKKDLGLEPEEATEPTNIISLTELQMENMWKNMPLSVFKIELKKLSDTQIDNLIDYAIEKKIVDTAKCSYLKEKTKRDILLAISRKEDMEALDRAEKNKQSNAVEGRRI
jgi:hypothetical protein